MNPTRRSPFRLWRRKSKVFLLLGGINRGFTLIEVMITLTVLGFILLIIFGVFRLGLSAWQKGESIKEEFQKVRIASQLISRQIKSIVPYKIKTQKAEGNYLAFEGTAHSIKFVSTFALRGRQPGGFVYAIYEFKEGGREGGQLVLYEQRVLNRDFMDDKPKEESGVSLLEEVSRVRFEYYQEEDAENKKVGGWVEEWNAKDKKELPKALRMTLIQKKGKGGEEETPVFLMTSLPSYQFEEVRTGPSRRVIPQRPPGTSY